MGEDRKRVGHHAQNVGDEHKQEDRQQEGNEASALLAQNIVNHAEAEVENYFRYRLPAPRHHLGAQRQNHHQHRDHSHGQDHEKRRVGHESQRCVFQSRQRRDVKLVHQVKCRLFAIAGFFSHSPIPYSSSR